MPVAAALPTDPIDWRDWSDLDIPDILAGRPEKETDLAPIPATMGAFRPIEPPVLAIKLGILATLNN